MARIGIAEKAVSHCARGIVVALGLGLATGAASAQDSTTEETPPAAPAAEAPTTAPAEGEGQAWLKICADDPNVKKNVCIVKQDLLTDTGHVTSHIVDRFSGSKIVTLHFAEDTMPSDLARYGEVLEIQVPKVKIRVARQAVARMLAAVLDRCAIEDVSVEDPPLEEVIADVFSQVDDNRTETEPISVDVS